MLKLMVGKMEIKFINTEDLEKQLNVKLAILNKQNGEILSKAKGIKKQINQINKAIRDLNSPNISNTPAQ